jgi:hypothetical protein
MTPEPTQLTPGPTATPPDALRCQAGVDDSHYLNIRNAPNIGAEWVGSLPPSTRIDVTALHITYNEASPIREEWAQIAQGWIALWYNGAELAYLDDAPPCWELPCTGDCAPVTATPEPGLITALGPRTVPGAAGFEAAYPILAAKGIPFGVSPYHSIEYCVRALNQGGVCVFRPGSPDCPNDVNTGDPRQSARNFMQYARGGAEILAGHEGVWIEPINECFHSPDTRTLAWYAEWMDEYTEQARAQGWPPLAWPGLPPGSGDALMFSTFEDVLRKVDSYGGLFSMHLYTYHSKTGLCVCDEWEACRHEHNYALMQEQGYTMTYTITEAARSAGNEVPDVDDFVCIYNKVNAVGFVHSLWMWLGGHNATWSSANLDGYYVPIAERVG